MRKRLKSIRTPPKRSAISPSKRPNLDDSGPTDFQLMRRAELIGEGVVCIVGTGEVKITGKVSPDVSSSLSILHHRQLITTPQFRAGQSYAALRRIIYGKAVPKGSALSKVIAESIFVTIARNQVSRKGTEMTIAERDEWFEEMQIAYYRGDNRLRKLFYARRVREIVRRVLIDDMMPEPKKPNQLARLREGLQELVDVWGTDK
jgi:hypothetical protein